jgi:predicted MFS family arabinose efflux permease
MNAREWRVTGALSLIYATRMLGLFALLPVLALYAGGLPGASSLLIGLALGSYGLTQALLQIPFGSLSDRYGRRPVITAGLVLFIVGSVVAAGAHDALGLVLGRALQGAGAVSAAVMALLADLTREEVRTHAMAVVGLSIGASYLVALPAGPALAGALGVPGLFVGIGILGVVAIALLWTAVPAPPRHLPAAAERGGLWRALRDAQLARLHFSIFALHALMTALFIVLPQRLADVLHVPAAAQGGWYLPLVLGSVVAMVPVLVWAERRRHLRGGMLLAVSLLLGALASLALGDGALALGAAVLAFLTGFNVLESLLPSLVSRLAPLTGKGAALGVYSTAQFLGAFAGGAGAGILHAAWGGSGVLWAGALLAAAWLVVLTVWSGPPPWATRLVRVGNIAPEQAPVLQARLAALAGVAESLVVADAGVAYLKIDRRRFEPDSVERLLAAGE